MKKLNEGLKKSQQKQREKTYLKIQEAVEFLREGKREITKVSIREESGLAAATFSKDHVKKFLLETYGLGAKRPVVLLKQGDDIKIEEYNKLLKQNAKLQADLRKAEQAREKERADECDVRGDRGGTRGGRAQSGDRRDAAARRAGRVLCRQ